MKNQKIITAILLTLSFALFVIACTTVPVTGRKQLSLIPESDLLTMSYQQYDQFLEEHELSDNAEKTEMVREVGHNIQRAVEEYFEERNMSNQLNGYEWEFNLVESEQVNAFCMPGGKVVVYQGIMPIADGENGLAVIMGHEIAHAVANHGGERMSQALVTQLGGMALSAALDQKPETTRQLALVAFGVGAQVGVLLPYSRLHESEADRLGLTFMAMAGYDPRGAVDFWQRMSEEKGGAAPPEFLSTHPSDQTRINQIKEYLPKALEEYNPS
jgi:predicted Zn-dependent protease